MPMADGEWASQSNAVERFDVTIHYRHHHHHHPNVFTHTDTNKRTIQTNNKPIELVHQTQNFSFSVFFFSSPFFYFELSFCCFVYIYCSVWRNFAATAEELINADGNQKFCLLLLFCSDLNSHTSVSAVSSVLHLVIFNCVVCVHITHCSPVSPSSSLVAGAPWQTTFA